MPARAARANRVFVPGFAQALPIAGKALVHDLEHELPFTVDRGHEREHSHPAVSEVP